MEITFVHEDKPEWSQVVHVYVAETWRGKPKESEEMKPDWFANHEIPFKSMWPDDAYWLPHVIQGKFVTATFVFLAEENKIIDYNMHVANKKV